MRDLSSLTEALLAAARRAGAEAADAMAVELETSKRSIYRDVATLMAQRVPIRGEAGIGYVHLRQLGAPKPGREAARKGRIAEMTAIFEDHLAEPAAQLELAAAKELAAERKIALLCFEADHRGCHRKILADRICEDLGCAIEHL